MVLEDKSELENEIDKLFKKFEDSDGFIPVNKLKLALRGLGFEPKKEDIKKLINEFDKKKTGLISRDDFKLIVFKKINEKNVNEEILRAFELFDKNKNGKLSFNDLKLVSEELGENIKDDELLEMIKVADTNEDNFVDKEEFLEVMKKTALY